MSTMYGSKILFFGIPSPTHTHTHTHTQCQPSSPDFPASAQPCLSKALSRTSGISWHCQLQPTHRLPEGHAGTAAALCHYPASDTGGQSGPETKAHRIGQYPPIRGSPPHSMAVLRRRYFFFFVKDRTLRTIPPIRNQWHEISPS
jgi:hypothetical protein